LGHIQDLHSQSMLSRCYNCSKGTSKGTSKRSATRQSKHLRNKCLSSRTEQSLKLERANIYYTSFKHCCFRIYKLDPFILQTLVLPFQKIRVGFCSPSLHLFDPKKKNGKTLILWNIITIPNNCISSHYFKLHGPSEIILICWFDAI